MVAFVLIRRGRHMFYDGVFDNLEGMKHVQPVPPEMFMDYVPDVAAFKKLDFKGADTYICVVRPLLSGFASPVG